MLKEEKRPQKLVILQWLNHPNQVKWVNISLNWMIYISRLQELCSHHIRGSWLTAMWSHRKYRSRTGQLMNDNDLQTVNFRLTITFYKHYIITTIFNRVQHLMEPMVTRTIPKSAMNVRWTGGLHPVDIFSLFMDGPSPYKNQKESRATK